MFLFQLLGCIVGPGNGISFGLSIAYVSAGLHSLYLEGLAGNAPFSLTEMETTMFGEDPRITVLLDGGKQTMDKQIPCWIDSNMHALI